VADPQCRMLKKTRLLTRPSLRAETRLAPSKAAASEEAKEVHTALCVGRSPLERILANGKAPPVIPRSERLSSVR